MCSSSFLSNCVGDAAVWWVWFCANYQTSYLCARPHLRYAYYLVTAIPHMNSASSSMKPPVKGSPMMLVISLLALVVRVYSAHNTYGKTISLTLVVSRAVRVRQARETMTLLVGQEEKSCHARTLILPWKVPGN